MAKLHRSKEPRNYRVMAGAFLVAAAFWFAVAMSGSFVATFEVPLSVVKLPEDVAVASEIPETIEIALEGTGWQLLFLSVGGQLQVELPGTRLQNKRAIPTLSLMAESVDLPVGMRVIRAYPESLSITLDELASKKVPLVFFDLSITFKENFGLTGDILLEPDSVTIAGAESVIKEITTWSIRKAEYTELALPVVEDLRVNDSLKGLVQVRPSRARLVIPVEQLADVSFMEVPVKVDDVPPGKEVLLMYSKVDVYVRGGVNTLSNLDYTDFSAIIDYPLLQQDTTGRIEPRILLPYGVSLLKIEPATIPYTVRNE